MSFIRSRKHPLPHIRPRSAAGGLATTLLGGLAIAGAAHAAEMPPIASVESASTLPSVKVHATRGPDYRVDALSSPKYSQPLLDTPQTVQVISSELIRQQGATTLTEALRNSAGVGTFFAGENGTTTTGDGITMRGFDTSGSLFVDGVRDLATISRDMFNIEQVEVTKGADGTAYGRTAPTGAINLVSKQPFLANRASGSVAYGIATQRRATADWNHALSARSAFRLNLIDQDSGVPGRDRVRNARWGVAPSLAFGLKTPTRVYLDLLHVKQSNVPDGGIPTLGLPGYTSPDPDRPFIDQAPAVDPSRFYGTSADHDDVQVDMATAIVEHDLGTNATLRNITRWARTRQDYLLTSFRLSAANLLTPDPSDPATWTLARDLPTFKQQANRIIANQTSMTTHVEAGPITHDLVTGLELSQETVRIAGVGVLDDTAWPDASVYAPTADASGLHYGHNGTHGQGKTNTAAAYLFDTLSFAERWQVHAGARLDRYRTDFSSMVLCGTRNAPACGGLAANTPVRGLDARVGGSLPNYRLGVLYKPAPNGSVYASVARSQEPPGGNALVLSSSTRSADNPQLDPQSARALELGTKWDVRDGRLLLTGALFRTNVRNELVQDPVDLEYRQIGRKRVQGLELGAVGRITDHWAVSTGFTALSARVVSGTAVAEDGSTDLAYTPRRAFTAWTSYQRPGGITVGGGARYVGGLKRGTDSAIGTPAATSGYWVFDAMLALPVNRHLSLQLNLSNLLDKRYVAAINKSGYRYVPGTPRAALLTAQIRF